VKKIIIACQIVFVVFFLVKALSHIDLLKQIPFPASLSWNSGDEAIAQTPAKAPTPPPKDITDDDLQKERELLTMLQKKQKDLEARENALKAEEQKIAALKKEVIEKIDALKALETQLNAKLDTEKTQDEKRFKELAKVYEATPPQKAAAMLESFGVAFDVRVISAHRTPELASDYAANAEARGLKVIIAAAGGAAHLGGVLAAHTVLPVIGIPVAGGALNGLDALYATLQMPAGVPVATVTLGSAGPVNAALLAVQILGTADPELREKFRAYKDGLKDKVAEGNAKVQVTARRAVRESPVRAPRWIRTDGTARGRG